MSALLQFVCHGCCKNLRAPTGLVGKSVKCPRCAMVIVVPAAEPTSAPTSPSKSAHPPAAIKSNSKLLSVLEGLIGPVPYGSAAVAHWQLSKQSRRGIMASVLGAFRRRRASMQRVGCIAVKCGFLHLFDFGDKPADARISESHLFDLVRQGAVPSITSTPLSSLFIKKSFGFSSKVAIVTGQLHLQVHPGFGDDFPGSLWTALCPGN
jgi:phage FluMu protein Com